MEKIIEWQAPDHELPERPTDWYLSVGVVGVAISVASFILGNLLFAIFCLLATASIIIHMAKKPESIEFSITDSGIQMRHDFFPYGKLRSFWIDHEKNKNDMVIHSNRSVLPHLVVPIRDVDPEEVREKLRRHIPEIYEHKNLIDKSIDYLGF